eukprot:CAMPEP_0170535610 /NCGR_PEP_ID=MMETSP0209-20121228/101698_1 /TAXON_ID=665100 ORGANISM="Litonotus pictus, Strain P1" /NCGR_SAMPLE_ID=MMETSP0209 /ASSEMBLY_ACC=CAM_ASM_000301 /LENGTH=145 /DNA_ID=CAMNT_0010836903 /DNA_START=601 /DNA_END=1041 /DNA_ORIENTATION=-
MNEKQEIKKIESTTIAWKNEEVNPTVSKKKKKVKAKGKSDVKTIVKTEECESFFNFFKNYTAEIDKKKVETKTAGEEDDDEEREDDLYIEEEYDLGVFIKDELIPYSLEYYLDIVDEEEDDEEMESDEDDLEEDEAETGGKKKLF